MKKYIIVMIGMLIPCVFARLSQYSMEQVTGQHKYVGPGDTYMSGNYGGSTYGVVQPSGSYGLSSTVSGLQQKASCQSVQQLLEQSSPIVGMCAVKNRSYAHQDFGMSCKFVTYKCQAAWAFSDFSYAKAQKANFSGAELSGVRFIQVHMDQADLSGVTAQLSPMIMKGAHVQKSDFLGAKLPGLIADGMQAQQANLAAADLTRAILDGADCTGADFSYATLMNVRAVKAIFRHANLTGVVLSGDISGADFTGAILAKNTVFKNITWSEGNPPIGLLSRIKQLDGGFWQIV